MALADANWTSAVSNVDLVLTDKWGTGASGTDKVRFAHGPHLFDDDLPLRTQLWRLWAGVRLIPTRNWSNFHAQDVAFDATVDPGLLNRAEWIKFLALFFNAESEANALYRSDEAGVQSVTSASAALSTAATGPKPLVVRSGNIHAARDGCTCRRCGIAQVAEAA